MATPAQPNGAVATTNEAASTTTSASNGIGTALPAASAAHAADTAHSKQPNGTSANATVNGVAAAAANPPPLNVGAGGMEQKSTKDAAAAALGAEQRGKDGKLLKPKHRKINKTHPEFELTYDMMLGIRTTVGQSKAHPPKLEPAHAQQTTKLEFPGQGSNVTPAHQMRTFAFKDYAPEIFRAIRELSGIDTLDYLLCICGNFKFLEFISNSKSGQFFFYSHDRRFMIKTISDEECVFLRSILWDYYLYMRDNPNTLITRFFGMHRVKPYKKKEYHFLIMASVFYTKAFIYKTFDLKGSKQGRAVTEKEKENPSCVYKDLDFLELKTTMNLGQKKDAFVKQLELDSKWLSDHNIMDYSLLVGIHYTDKEKPQSAPASPATPETRSIDPLSWNSPAKPAAAFVITPLKPSFHVNGDSKHDDKDVETGDLKKLHEKRPSASTAAAATASSATAIAGTSNSTDASTAAAAVAATAGTMPAASASTTAPTSTAATTADEGSDDEEYRNWKSKQSISMDQPIAILPSRLSAASSASASAAAPTSTSGSLVAYADDDLDFSNDGMDVNNQPVSAQPKSKIDLANSLGLSSVTAQFASAVGTNSNAIVPPLAFHHIPIPAVHNPSNKPLNNSAATSGFHTPRKSTASSAALSSSVASSSSTALPMTPSSVQQTPPLTPIQPSPETAAKLKELRVQPPTLSPAPATPGVPEVEVVDAAEFDRIPGRQAGKLQAYYGMPKNYRLKKAADIGFVAPDLFDQLMTGALNVAVQVASHDVRAMVAAAQSVDQSHKLTKAMLAESHQKQQTAAAASAPSLFTRDEGGIRSERGNEIYFLGIIDILTEYNLKKKIESGLKSLKYNRYDISAVDPALYASRFRKFITDALR